MPTPSMTVTVGIFQSVNQIVIPLGRKKESESQQLNHENAIEIPSFFPPHKLVQEWIQNITSSFLTIKTNEQQIIQETFKMQTFKAATQWREPNPAHSKADSPTQRHPAPDYTVPPAAPTRVTLRRTGFNDWKWTPVTHTIRRQLTRPRQELK